MGTFTTAFEEILNENYAVELDVTYNVNAGSKSENAFPEDVEAVDVLSAVDEDDKPVELTESLKSSILHYVNKYRSDSLDARAINDMERHG